MTPLEELQAAHKRLSELADGCGMGWRALEVNRRNKAFRHWQVRDELNDDMGLTIDEGQVAALIVTLHRTIDAQLSMLNMGIAQQKLLAERWCDDYAEASVVDLDGIVGLARAINGEAS